MFKSKYTGEEIEAILDDAKTPYTLPIASSNTLGGVKTNYTQSGKNYPVKTDSSGNAFVNVPWSDTNTTYGVVSTSANGLMPKLPTDSIATGNNTSTPAMQVLTGDGKYKALDLGYNQIINKLTLGFYDAATGVGSVGATIPVASTTADGLMSKSDKQKIDGIEDFTGATTDNAGTAGLVPAPAKMSTATTAHKYCLLNDGTWGDLDDYNGKHAGLVPKCLATQINRTNMYLQVNGKWGKIPDATVDTSGLMSATDKQNLQSLTEVATISYNVPSGATNSSVKVDIPLRKGCYIYKCTANFIDISEEVIFMACIGETMGMAPHIFLFCEDAEFSLDGSNAIRDGSTWIARLNVIRFDAINTVTVNMSKIVL